MQGRGHWSTYFIDRHRTAHEQCYAALVMRPVMPVLFNIFWSKHAHTDSDTSALDAEAVRIAKLWNSKTWTIAESK